LKRGHEDRGKNFFPIQPSPDSSQSVFWQDESPDLPTEKQQAALLEAMQESRSLWRVKQQMANPFFDYRYAKIPNPSGWYLIHFPRGAVGPFSFSIFQIKLRLSFGKKEEFGGNWSGTHRTLPER